MLLGREVERHRIDALLQSARDDRSAVLVLRGEAGIGKTALLDHAAEQATGMNVLRCVGIEAEHELPFAAMHQLVRPCLGLLDRLPPPQEAALRSALGLRADAVEDRFLVALGLLSLLAEASEQRPTLCCVDDAQWLDRPSAEALVFAARRFEAESIAVVLAAREGELRRFDAPGLPELEVPRLDAADARALLGARLDGGASAEVLDALLSAAAGNPLALLELPAGLTPGQLRGTEPILGPPPVRPAVEQAFRARVEALSPQTARVLLIAAADEAGDLASIRRAAGALELDAAAELDVAERTGLVRVNGAVAFRHPLVRSAVYRSAPRSERKAVHEALATAVADPVRAAWHRALVADGADEAIAGELEAAALQAAARGAHATATAAFERAAELSEEDAAMGRRLQRAAQASVDAGRPEAGLALVERARPLVRDPVDQASLNLVCSAVVGRRGTPAEAYALVSEAAQKLAEPAPDMALELVLWSLGAAFQGGWGERVLGEARGKVGAIATDGEPMRFARLFLEGSQALVDGRVSAACDQLDAALDIAERARSDAVLDFGAGPLLFHSVFISLSRGDLSRAQALLADALAADRAHGGIAVLVAILPLCAFAETSARRPAAATALVAEGLEIADQLGFDNDRTGLLAMQARIAALEGREEDCRASAEAALRHGTANEIGWATAGAEAHGPHGRRMEDQDRRQPEQSHGRPRGARAAVGHDGCGDGRDPRDRPDTDEHAGARGVVQRQGRAGHRLALSRGGVVRVLDEHPGRHPEDRFPGAVEQHERCDRQPADPRRRPREVPEQQVEHLAGQPDEREAGEMDAHPARGLVPEALVDAFGAGAGAVEHQQHRPGERYPGDEGES